MRHVGATRQVEIMARLLLMINRKRRDDETRGRFNRKAWWWRANRFEIIGRVQSIISFRNFM